jgi:hypothetical protein
VQIKCKIVTVNKDQLKKNRGYHVRVRPVALRSGGLPQIDDDWLIESVDDVGLTIKNTRTEHRSLLAYDHIREFMTDVARDTGGIKHGFLRLKVQLTLTDGNVLIEPLWESLPPVAQRELSKVLNEKPNIMMIGYQYLWLKTDENHIWRETWRDSSEGQKALLFTFVNNPDPSGSGLDAFSVRAQVTFEWDTGAPGPNFSPVPWLGEERSFIDIPLGVEKKLVIGTGLGPQQGWYGYKSNRINGGWARGVNPLESNPIPDLGKMRVRLIASVEGKSEIIWMSCFSWKVQFNPNHPWFEQISCKELEAV